MLRWSLVLLSTSSLLFGCLGSTAPVAGAADPNVRPPGLAADIVGEVFFEGMCDASGAVAQSSRRLIAADDEDNVLRSYDAERGGPPGWSVDLSAALGLPLQGKKRPRHPEVDLEAATLLGDRAFWISSHGRNARGKRKAERLQFLATTVPGDGAELTLIGAYDGVLRDLLADPRYAGFDLASASELAPKAPGGLNIEGLTASSDGHLLIGFRNPIPTGAR